MTILEDSNNKPGKHRLKNTYWQKNGIQVVRQRLPVGDYVLVNEKIADVFSRKEKRVIEVKMMDLMGTYNVAVDSKRDIAEIASNVCGSRQQHDRFRDECVLAMNNNIKLYVVVENNDGIADLRDLHKWVNPRLFIRRGGKQLYPNATRGVTLMKSCMTMERKYNSVKFIFCKPEESGKRIIELLEGDKNE